MTQQTINIGAVADDGTGDPARTAFDKVNGNFSELYSLRAVGAVTSGTIDGAVIGGITPAAGSFTNISASGTIGGAGFTGWLASPPAIGGTTPAAGSFTSVSLTGSITPVDGIYRPSAHTLGFSTNSAQWGTLNGTGNWNLVAPSSGSTLTVNGVTASTGAISAIYSSSGSGQEIYANFTNNIDSNWQLAISQIGAVTKYATMGPTTATAFNFQTASATRLSLGAAGNVTINAPSSGTALTVAGQVKVTPASGQAVIDGVYAGTATGSNLGALRFYGTGGGVTGEVDITGVLETGSLVNSACLFYTTLSGSLTEKMRLDSSGNLGLGVTPSAWSSWKALQNQQASFAAISGYAVMAQNWYAAPADTRIAADYATQYYQHSGQHVWQTAGTSTAGSAITWAQAMTLDASGNLLVGGSALGPSNINALHIQPAFGNLLHQHANGTASGTGYASYYYNGGAIGSITQSGTTAVLYNTTSDQRLKTNIVDAAPASALIDAIKVRSFDWISDNSHQRYGMVAQELYEVVPEAVHSPEDPEAMMAVDYSKLVPLLVKEIQDLRKRLAALEAK